MFDFTIKLISRELSAFCVNSSAEAFRKLTSVNYKHSSTDERLSFEDFSSRDRPKFGFGYGAETGDIFSFGYGRNHEARFQPTYGYDRNYKVLV